MSENNLYIIEEFYKSRCNDSWEHDYGFIIETCDNPGWLLTWKDNIMPHFFTEENYIHKMDCIQQRFNIDILMNLSNLENMVHEDFEIRVFGDSLISVINGLTEIIKSDPVPVQCCKLKELKSIK